MSKVRGRKKALAELVRMMDERIGSWKDKNQTIFISHGDCEKDARMVADLVREKYGIEDIHIHPVGATIEPMRVLERLHCSSLGTNGKES